MTLEKQSIYQPKRNHSVDLMKSILVILMIMAHVVQFFPCGKIAGVFSGIGYTVLVSHHFSLTGIGKIIGLQKNTWVFRIFA